MIFKYIFPQDKAISREVFTLALPVILSNLSRVLMSLIDVAMVGRLGAAAIAATGDGSHAFLGSLKPGPGNSDSGADCCLQASGAKEIQPVRHRFSQWTFDGNLVRYPCIHSRLAVGKRFHSIFY